MSTDLSEANLPLAQAPAVGSNPFERIGLILPLALLAALMATALHQLGPLAEVPYTAFRPLGLLRDALARPFVPTVLVVAFGLGCCVRPGASPANLARRLRTWLTPASLMVGVALLVADITLFPDHHWIDRGVILLLGMGAWSHLRSKGVRSAAILAGEALITCLCFLLVSYAFTVVKAHLFLGASPRDPVLFAWERELFGQPLHSLIATWASKNPLVVRVCDDVYYRFFEHMIATACFLAGVGKRAVRQRYFGALFLCYILGGLAYHLVPAVGPAFFDRESFAFLRTQDLITNFFQASLSLNTQDVQRGLLAWMPSYEFLAAMPSLHIAHEVVIVYHARYSVLALVLGCAFFLLTVLAVLVLGWHYLADVLGGLLLGAIAIGLSSLIGNRWYPLAQRGERPPK